MSAIPTTIKTAIKASISVMLAPTGIPQNQIDAALHALFSVLEGKGDATTLTNRQPIERVYSRKEAAELLGVTPVTITRMVASGRLRGIYGGANGARLTGISGGSLRALLEGRAK